MKILLIIGLFVMAASIIVFSPLLSIWCLNTLFPVLAIPYTLDTWCAAFLLTSFLSFNLLKAK
jgi:hypothetical protein